MTIVIYHRRILSVVIALGFIARFWMAISTPVAFDEYQWFRIVDTVDLHPLSFHLPLHGDEHPLVTSIGLLLVRGFSAGIWWAIGLLQLSSERLSFFSFLLV
jgi:hypothetical protein